MPSNHKLGVVMDPISTLHYKKDSTLALLWEAQDRGFELYYFEQKDLFLQQSRAFGHGRLLNVFKDPNQWFTLSEPKSLPLSELNVILMRKDPPFDLEYIYTTYLLEQAEREGVTVVNKPQSLRDTNEKFATSSFPECCPPTLVTRDLSLLRQFLLEQKNIVCKPLGAMGGHSVFKVHHPDLNANVIFETITANGTHYAMAQRYIPEITQGDKRILLIQGEPIPFALARVPSLEDFRGNLAAGAKGIARPLTNRDRWICQQVGPALKERGLFFAGIDVIGDYLTEINVTSPTGIRELDEQCRINISAQFFDQLFLKGI